MKDMARTIEQRIDIFVNFGFGMFMTSLSILFLIAAVWVVTHWG